MRIATALALALLVQPITASAAGLATVDVDASSAGPVIPNDFDGFSIEVNDSAQKYLGTEVAPNLVFEQLLRNLGRATIRIGGNSSDFSCWNPGAAPFPAGCQFQITPPVVRGFAQASARTGWSLIGGLNLAQNDGEWASQYAVALTQAIAATPGSRLIGFEIGNEPDLFSSNALFDHHAIRPKGYSWPNLVADWKPYVAALKAQAATSAYPLFGPAYDDSSDVWRNAYVAPFVRGIGTGSVGTLTLHEYPTYTCGGNTVTIAQLLAPSLMATYVSQARHWVSTARQLGLPLELGETNSTACGGQWGVDDVFAATLWGLDWLFTNAELGIRRQNFHMDGAAYSAVHVKTGVSGGHTAYANTVEPLYYAMYAFSTLAQGRATLATQVTSSFNVRGYAVAGDPGHVARVFVINKDLKAGGNVTVHVTAHGGSARLLVLQAPALNSKHVTFGGTSFDNATGRLQATPSTTAIQPNAAGDYVFTMPNASIAILTIDR